MFRSLASSLITLIAILLFALVLLFLWSGSEGVEFARNPFPGDRSTVQVLDDYRREQLKASELAQANRNMGRDTETETPEPSKTSSSSGDGPAVVLWISVPGFRGDYLEKAETAFFDKLATDGGGTNKLRPNFPCLTFPAHATLATGVTADKHGIIADRIRTADGTIVDSPTDPALLTAEPIWATATRQGIRTMVLDWPLSQNQTGDNKAAIFETAYDPESTDEARLNKALEKWKADSASAGDNKLRLVMLRLDDIFRQGRLHGPRADETFAAVSATDKALQKFVETVQGELGTLATPDANLVILITTDHGLAELDKNVNIGHLLGDAMMANADVIAHDAIANLYFKNLPENEAEKKIFIDKFDNELSKRIYFRTIKKEELPAEWAYQHPERTGDRVLVLKTGYAFADQKASEPVFDPTEGPNFFGAFGYPVEESIRMSGQIFIAGYPNSPLSGALAEIGQTAFHATVCKLLGIQPAEGAAAETLPLK